MMSWFSLCMHNYFVDATFVMTEDRKNGLAALLCLLLVQRNKNSFFGGTC